MIIEVRISKHKMTQLGNHSVHIGNHTMRALRDAGVPVDGAVGVTWLHDGALTVRTDDEDLVYVWQGDAPLVKAVEAEAEIW